MESPPTSPRLANAAAFGIAAGLPVALVYGVLADPVGLSWGLIIVGLVAGAAIGAALARGAWNGRFHLIVPRVRWLAVLISVVTWAAAVVVAYVASQVLYQGATTPLGNRLSLSGFIEYFGGATVSPNLLGLAAMAFTAWRGAR